MKEYFEVKGGEVKGNYNGLKVGRKQGKLKHTRRKQEQFRHNLKNLGQEEKMEDRNNEQKKNT